jgi:hypothetical protein
MTTSNGPRFAQVHVQLSGHDGNVFAIMGRVFGRFERMARLSQILMSLWRR